MEERFICTKENPWTKDKGMAAHPDAKVIYSNDRYYYWEDGYERYKCPHCGLKFKVTLPSH